MAIEESLLGNSQFLGRDGFRWWIGQVAPREAQKDQIDDGDGSVSYTHLTLPTKRIV